MRIKLIIVSLGAGFAALISSFTGITPQAAFAPMVGWMLGFSAAKAQATAMRVTAGMSIACVVGALWQSSIKDVISPKADARITQVNIAHAFPSSFILTVCMLFIGATVGAALAVKAAPRADKVAVRRAFLFSGVCIGMYLAVEGAHYSTLAASRAPVLQGAAAMLLLGAISGALTQILGLASGVILVPSLLYFAGFSMQQSILVSLMVIGLVALLPAWSYNRLGLGDARYGGAGLVGGIGCGFVGGALLVAAPAKLLMMLFGLMAMFFSAREISITAAGQTPDPTGPSGPDLS